MSWSERVIPIRCRCLFFFSTNGLGELHLRAADRNEACGNLGRGCRIHDAGVVGEEGSTIHGIGLPRGDGAISEPRKSGPGQNGDVIRPDGVDYAQNSMWAANV